MQNKTYFISDAHLGAGADSRKRESDMVTWLGNVEHDAKRIVLLGDIFDFWFSYRHVVPRGHVRLLGKLAELSDKGIELHFFIGNHDMWIFDYLTSEMNITMHDNPEIVEWDGKTLLVGHGDGLDAKDRSYNCLKRMFRNRFCQHLFAIVHPAIGFGIAERWSNRSRQSHNEERNHNSGIQTDAIEKYCIAQQEAYRPKGKIDFFIFGHSHVPRQRSLNDSTYTNTGNWIEDRDYAVFDGEEVRLLSMTSTQP